MCPLFSSFVFIILIFGPFFLLCSAVPWQVQFKPDTKEMHMNTVESIDLLINNLNYDELQRDQATIYIRSNNENLAFVEKRIEAPDIEPSGKWNGSFEINAIFMGKTDIYVELQRKNSTEKSDNVLPIVVIREMKVIDHVFTGSVALLVSILYINFGAALDLDVLKGILKRPIGPCIGFFGQFVVMPVLSYVIGLGLFPNDPYMHLGLFFTGCSPAGGASNIWTVILGGNIDLSITMTTISTIAAFGMMPLWLFTLGKVIFDKSDIAVPYSNLSTYVISLIVPLFIGILIKRYLPKVGHFLVRILKTFSVILIIFIVVFAIVTNLYLFELFTWEIIVAGLLLPWVAYTLGFGIAVLLKQNYRDAIAIALETGIQNTGIAIFLLRLSLDQPEADLTTIMPVTVSIMTPIPLICLFGILRIRDVILSRTVEKKNIVPMENGISVVS